MKKHILKSIYTLAICAASLTWALPAHAVCSNNMDGTPGVAAEIEFFTPDNVLRYCDGTNWVDMVYNGPIPPDSSSIVEFFSDLFIAPNPETQYVANAVNFDGTSIYLNGASSLNAATGSWTTSFWLRPTGIAENDQMFVSETGKVVIRLRDDDSFQIVGKDSSDGTILRITTPVNSVTRDQWNHVAFSYDLSDISRQHFYINDQTVSTTVANFSVGTLIETDEIDYGIAATQSGGSPFEGDLADFWLDFGTYIDLSVETNRRQFISAERAPVDLGEYGHTPTGDRPDIFLSGDTAAWHTNKGSGGGFTENGALTDGPNVAPNGLVAHLRLDETSGTTVTDSSPNTNNGTMQNGLDAGSDSISAPLESALQFDGTNQFIAVPANATIEDIFDGGGSVSFWFKPNATDSSNIIMTKDQWNILEFSGAAGESGLNFRKTFSGDDGTWRRSNTTPDITANQWNHIVFQYNADSTANAPEVYINGTLADPLAQIVAPTGTRTSDSTRQTSIGASSSGVSAINAGIDDIRLYNRLITTDEITALYELGKDRASLVAHFKLDETTGTTATDSSVFENTGSYVDGVTPAEDSAKAVIDTGISFDSDGNSNRRVTAPNIDTYNDINALTFAAWVKPNSFSGNMGLIELVDLGHLRFRFNNNQLEYESNGWSGGDAQWRTDLTSIQTDEWTHVALTYNPIDTSSVPVFYINGAVEAISSVVTPSGTYTNPGTSVLNVGRTVYNGSGNNFNGSMDDARVYNRALSASEIFDLYNIVDEALVGHYKLDETSGTVAADSSGNGNDGTMQNGLTGAATTDGVIDTALTLTDGGANQRIRVTDVTDFDFAKTNAFTVGGWVKTTNANMIIAQSGSSLNNSSQISFSVRAYALGSQYQVQISDGSATRTLFGGTRDNGVWEHISATWDGENLRLYENGILVNSGTYTNYKLHNGSFHQLYIASEPTGGTDGDVDDVRIYNRALSASEIQDLVRTGTGGLVAHYKLDETSGTIAEDSSLFRNDGTMTGGLDASNDRIDGPVNTALSFDNSDDDISLGQNTTFDFSDTNAFTISAWVYPEAGSDGGTIFGRGFSTSSSANYAYYFERYSPNPSRWLSTVSSGSGSTGSVSPIGTVDENQWQHMTTTWNGSIVTIYKNGVLISSNNNPRSLSEPASAVNRETSIGNSGRGNAAPFEGNIDDVRVFDRALTDAEILALYDAGDIPPTPDDGLLGYYKLDETSGTAIADSSGNGNDGTTNAVTLPADSVTGEIDTAIDFNSTGQARVDIPSTNFLDMKTFSVAFWGNLATSDGGFKRVASLSDLFVISSDFDTTQFNFAATAWDTQGTWRVGSAAGFDVDQWSHYVVTYSYDDPVGTVPKFYKNGVQISHSSTVSPSGSFNTPTATQLRIGGNTANGQSWKGALDDVRIYNRILSDSEIQSLYGCTGAGSYFFNPTDAIMQWCDDINAPNDMGPITTLGTSACNVGNGQFARGGMDYDADTDTSYYCNGTFEVPIGRRPSNTGGSATEKIAFITNDAHLPRLLGGVTAADALCQSEAEQSDLSGTYLAWIADSDPASAPATRFSSDIRGGAFSIIKPDGTLIANDWADLTDGTLQSNIDVIPYGTELTSSVNVTTSNVTASGTQLSATNTCSDYTANTGNIDKGDRRQVNSNWSSGITQSCGAGGFLYCFEQ